MRRNPGGGRGLPDLARPIGTAKEERTKLLDSASGLAGRWAPLSSRPCLPSRWRNTNSRAPSLRGHYPASPLLRAHPPPSRLRPTSRGVRLYGRACSACPCHRAVATTPPERIASSANLRRSVRPSPDDRGLGLRGFHTFGATCAFTLVTARRLAHHPEDGFRQWASGHSVSLLPAIRATGRWLLPRWG